MLNVGNKPPNIARTIKHKEGGGAKAATTTNDIDPSTITTQ